MVRSFARLPRFQPRLRKKSGHGDVMIVVDVVATTVAALAAMTVAALAVVLLAALVVATVVAAAIVAVATVAVAVALADAREENDNAIAKACEIPQAP